VIALQPTSSYNYCVNNIDSRLKQYEHPNNFLDFIFHVMKQIYEWSGEDIPPFSFSLTPHFVTGFGRTLGSY
jgi:hypothetical protein